MNPDTAAAQPDNSPAGSLAGILVADFSRVLAGPYATMMLGDLGARIIKVERPGAGDDTRAWGPPYDADGRATYFESVNRNKESVALDLRDAADIELARELIRRADVVIENFSPGTFARLGFTDDAMAELNPRLVRCSISGFGTGAGAHYPGYDLLVQAMGGLMSVTGPDADHPSKAGVALVDVITGLHATVGILAALRERDHSGQGQRIEVNLLSSLLSALVNQASAYAGAGAIPQQMGNAHPSISPYEVYDTGQGPLVLAVGNDAQFQRLCRELGREDLAQDERFATNPQRVAHRDELKTELTQALQSQSAQQWFTQLMAAGIPCGPINNLAGAFTLAQELGLEPIVSVSDPTREHASQQVASPLNLSRTPVQYRSAPPALGAESESIRTWLGA